MTNLVATTPITTKAMKSLYAQLNRQKDLKRTYRRRYKDLQAVVATTTDTSATVSHPVTVTSSKVTPNTQVTKTTSARQQRKIPDKGKAKSLGKLKKNVAKTTLNTTAGSSANSRSQLRDKAKHTATLIQEITEELQAIEEESSKINIQMPPRKVIYNKRIVIIHLQKMNNDYVKDKIHLSVIAIQILKMRNVTKVKLLKQKCQNRILITQKKLSLVQNKEQSFLLKLVLQCVTF